MSLPTEQIYTLRFRRKNAWSEGLLAGLAGSLPVSRFASALYSKAHEPKNDEHGGQGLLVAITSNLVGLTAGLGTILVGTAVGLSVRGGTTEYVVNQQPSCLKRRFGK